MPPFFCCFSLVLLDALLQLEQALTQFTAIHLNAMVSR